ncbi:hypothetical protein CKAN_00276800 [Cinnamomum micranthum f. kanehirae]|uniref:Uncharacterized protein n=1 Tax=Cinnamomum micranthum f. kanehirae TaxID=337451 RepID=A0A443N7D5_9MAGN|nr:hypothetical protein CKAN_00276800 [Cinnamomum micranthum f. kanehirae]
MASRATSFWRSMVGRVGGGGSSSRRFTSTAAPTIDMFLNEPVKPNPRIMRGDFVPVYVALGMIMLSMSFGLNCAKQQLLYAPNVFVSKKKRETFPEVNDPDYVVDEADKFITKSFFRRIAHVQEFDKDKVMSNPISGDALKSAKHAVTLKSVGVEPSKV